MLKHDEFKHTIALLGNKTDNGQYLFTNITSPVQARGHSFDILIWVNKTSKMEMFDIQQSLTPNGIESEL